jgi:antitoxin CptB
MDLILGPFIDRYLSGLSDEELDELERLLAVPDTTVYRWLSGQEAVPVERESALLGRLKAWTENPAK